MQGGVNRGHLRRGSEEKRLVEVLSGVVAATVAVGSVAAVASLPCEAVKAALVGKIVVAFDNGGNAAAAAAESPGLLSGICSRHSYHSEASSF